MLIIVRRVGEAVRIGDAYVTITRINGNRATLGIEAPQQTNIVRCELEGGRPAPYMPKPAPVV
jgi:carbon storage regulator CsrA